MKGFWTLAFLLACSSQSAEDIAGDYTLALTSGANGCQIQGWTVGQMSTGIPVTITQSGTTATATVTGTAQLALDAALGDHVFTGSVDGASFDLIQHGTRSMVTNGCTYTLQAHIVGDLTGDSISGQVNYTTATNDSPNCGTLGSCLSQQNYNGSRPPK